MNSMVSITEDDEFFETRSNDIGDMSVRLLVDLLEMDEYRMHLMLGAHFPTGSISDQAETPLAGGATQILPFPPFGLNLYFQDGLADGSRLSVEYYYPVHEDLNGPQLSASSSVIASWQMVF